MARGRLAGFVIAGVVAVGAFVLLRADDPTRFPPIAVEGNAELIDQAMADYQTNIVAAGEDVALQAVVNGWVARDLLFIQAQQFDALSSQISVLSAQTDAYGQADQPDDRVPALLLIGLLTIIFHLGTAPDSRLT